MRSARMRCSRQQGTLKLWMFFFFVIHEVQCSLPSPQNVTIISLNLEHRLTWTPGPGTAALTHFRVQTYNQKKNPWISVKDCSRLQTGESCDLTNCFKETLSLYQARVQAFTQDQESNWTTSNVFIPLMDTTLGPPLVSLTGCGNCLLLNLSPPVSLNQKSDLLRYLYQRYAVSVSRTRDKAQFSIKASNGETVINYLEPGAEYCVTAIVETSFKNHPLPSDPQCTYTSPQPPNTVAMLLSALCGLSLLLLCAALIYTSQHDNIHTPFLRPLVGFFPLLERR